MAKKPLTNTQLLEEYLKDAELQGLTEESRDAYRSSLNGFLGFLGRKSSLQVGVPELRDYLADQRRQKFEPGTLRAHFSAVSSFYDFLVYEERVKGNPVPGFRKRYFTTIRREAGKDKTGRRQLLSIEDMRRLIHSITDVRDRAFLVLLTKTGTRREELISVDLDEIDWIQGSITLKPHPKRTNCLVFFDDESARVLRRWLAIRQARGANTNALFTGDQGGRLSSDQASKIISGHAQALGLHDPKGPLKKRFTPHCCRHFFSTYLRRAGMMREHIAWLRGDAGTETLDIYLHNDPQEIRESYRARIPQFGL
ncbi:MAG: integrase/recombinase XerD [Thermoplasmata archaeon]|jgi:integrase/recombinase XerD|nr:integrase/recombinase XerD [Thermoplasmata archaeon]